MLDWSVQRETHTIVGRSRSRPAALCAILDWRDCPHMLARLRPTLDFMPSPVQDRPGLLIRDPFRFSDATLILPPALVACLEFFDGNHSELDLRAYLVQITGDLDVGGLVRHLVDTLANAGFLEDENFARIKNAAELGFA